MDFFTVHSIGREEYEALRSIASLTARERYLEGACASLLSIPIGRVRMGLRHEPSMARVTPGLPARQLLEGVAFEELYEQLKALTRGKRGITRESLHAFIDALATMKDRVRGAYAVAAAADVIVQFKALGETLGGVVTDLLVPAVVWLSYLAKDAEQPVSAMQSAIGDQAPDEDAAPTADL